jgi:DNA topoisomerase-3
VDREIRIKDFNSKPFYNIQATFATPNKTGGTYQGTWTNPDFKSDPTAPEKKADRVSTISEAKIIQDRIKNHNSKIKDEEKVIKENPPSLYNLNEIQRDANKLYSWSAKKTLDIAQQLYERHKIISYPRTESTSLPEDYVAEVTKIFKEITPHPLGHYVKLAHDPATAPNKKQIFNDKEISDHFAIIPTGETPGQLDADETKLYGLVVRRFVAAFCSPAEKKQIQRQTIIDNNEKDLFVCKSTLLSVAGWRAAYDEKAGKFTPVELPGHTNDPAVITDLKLHEGNTQPPNRYTESDILGIMENIANLIEDPALKAVTKKRGLGTSATRGDTIDKLKRVGYINIQGKSLVPTPKAVHLIISLRQLGLDSITNPAMTGDWEVNLQEVEKGQRSYATFMTTIEDYTKDFIEKLRVEANKNPASSSNRGPASEYSHNCPHCDSPLKSYDSHIACSKFNWKDPKACHFKIQKTLLGREMKEDEIETLITTHKTELLLGFISKTGRPFNAALSIDKKDGNIKFNYN